MTSLVRAAVLADFAAVALEAGIDPHKAMRKAGVDATALTKPDCLIATDHVAWLLETSAESSGLPDFAIRLAMRRRLANLGVTGLVLGQQSTVRDALTMADRYRHLLNDALSVYLEEKGDAATLTVAVAMSPTAPARQAVELAVSAYVHLFRLLLGESWAPASVHFSHAPPRGRTLHRRFFRCPIVFDAMFSGFDCSSRDLDRRNEATDRSLGEYASALLDGLPGRHGDTTSAVVRRLIVALLPMARASIAQVSKSLGKNVRTLQREIEAEGATFSGLLSDARHGLAMTYLRDTRISVEEIAQRLGYSCAPAFIRAYRNRFGIPPAKWRELQSRQEART